MNMRRMIGAAAALGLALAAAAQNIGRISGTVYDLNGKPWLGVSIEIKSEQSGTSYTTKTDKKGQYVQVGLASGIYTITYRNDEARVNYEVRVRVGMGAPDDVTQDVNFKEVISKNAQYAEAMKKQEEEKQKYENMKAHFQSGVAAMNEAVLNQVADVRHLDDPEPVGLQQQPQALRALLMGACLVTGRGRRSS